MDKNGPGVKIADFKARLSHYLRGVRRGRQLTIYDRDTPVAIVLPYNGGSFRRLAVRKSTCDPKAVTIRHASGKINSLELLLEERGERLS
ncbi:MAG: type II toxin-antitoxin system prevent-host-death family antitoxin [Planctomycetes bacterium]|nr:type II toxin-antitoxin system prevent-host-death family antitoxin [Planctomycetota bacterium]